MGERSEEPQPRAEPGGPRWRVPLSDLLVDDEMVELVGDVVRSGWWSMGPRVEAFEQAFAEFAGARHAVAVSSGTAALHIALLAAGCGPGDEVVVPSLNFVAAANTIAHCGARPVFCDIAGGSDLNLDPRDVERAAGPATRAIVVLHYAGFACDIEPVLAFARDAGLAVIEDAAHAPGTTLDGRMCGTFGEAGCFSFFSNKNLPVGEGGMVTTDDDELASRLRLLRSHGMTSLTWDRHRGHAHSYDVVAQGFNYRLDEARAALGLLQLDRLPAANEARLRIVARYRSGLDGEEGLAMAFPDRPGSETASHHLAVVILPEHAPRADVQASLADDGIQTSVHYPPIHQMSLYRESATRPLPQTDGLAGRILTLPLYAHMRDEDVELVITTLRAAIAGARG